MNLAPDITRHIRILHKKLRGDISVGIKTLVAYYSLKGSVKSAAETLSTGMGADLYEIKAVKNYRGVGVMRAGFESILSKKNSEIEKVGIDIGQYDRVVLAGPIWAGSLAGPVKSFAKECAGQVKKVIYISVDASNTQDYSAAFDELDTILGISRTDSLCLCKRTDYISQIKGYAVRIK